MSDQLSAETLLISKIAKEMDVDVALIETKVDKPIMAIGLSSVVVLELIQETIDELKLNKEATGLFGAGTKPNDITIKSVSHAIQL